MYITAAIAELRTFFWDILFFRSSASLKETHKNSNENQSMNFYLMHFIDLHIGFILFNVIPCHSFHSFCSCHIYFIHLTHVVSACLVGLSMWGFVKTPISIKWFFRTLSFFSLLSFSQALASHLHQAIHIVVSLGDASFQTQALHLFFLEILVPAKLRFSYAKQDAHHQKWAVSQTDHF